MNRTTSSVSTEADVPGSGAEGAKRHFDTFETQFFKQGDDSEIAQEAERFEDLDDGGRSRRFALSRRFVLGVAAGSVCVAVIGCVALWHGGNRSAPASLESSTTAAEPATPAVPNPVVAAPAASTPAPALVAQAPHAGLAPAEPTPALPPAQAMAIPAPAEAQAHPVAPAVAVADDKPAPAAAAPTAATAEPPAAALPAVGAADPPAAPAPAAATTPEAVPALADAASLRAKCKAAVGGRRPKDILSSCEAAFAADPNAADIAVILAKTEFDKGRTAQAMVWSKKALAVDPNAPSAADAYVFLGGAEQSAGHNKAAKEAYKRYLQLAPGGRYASDLRAIVGSL